MVALALLMVVGLPFAAAAVLVAPPMDLTATAVPEGVRLTWNAPLDAPDDVTYTISRDGFVLQTGLTALSYVDQAPSGASVYAVTAVTAAGESVPALTGFLPPDCVNVYPVGTIPPAGVDPDCLGVP
jgi:hypothetical protein